MNKFEQVLTDDELWAAAAEVEWQGTLGQYRLIEQAVLAKLAEQQEPAAWRFWLNGLQRWSYSSTHHGCGEPVYTHPMPCVSPTSDKTACVSENGESEMQELLPLPKPNCRSPSGIGYFDSFTKDQMIDYAKSAIDHYRATSNHIADKRKMVTPLAQRKIQTLLDKGEYRAIENTTVLVNENGHAAIVNRGGAFYWVDNEALAREFDAAPKYTGEK